MPPRVDPQSIRWDAAAEDFLRRVIAAKGQWYARRVVDPSPELLAVLYAAGYDPFAPDNKSGRGRLHARDAWRRAFVRAVYRANDRRHGGPGRAIELQVGLKLPRRGVIPPGRPVRGRVHRGGQAARAAAARLPDDQQWTDGGRSDPAQRDWAGPE